MTSGEFTSFPLDKVWVDRANRQRRTLDEIDTMADSLRRTGLIHPITITRTGELKTGERRYEAAKKLGWSHINVQFIDELDPAALQLLELEENVRRKDLTWQEQAAAIQAYHKLRTAEGDWSQGKTAEALGFSQNSVSRYLAVSEAIERGDERVIQSPKLSTAVGIVERTQSRVKSAVLDKITEQVTGEAPPEKVAPLVNADFSLWEKSYDGPRHFNFIHCDFPYGVSADKHDQGASGSFGGYTDSFETYEALLVVLKESMQTVIADSAHLMFWFSMDYYQWTYDTLTEMGWSVNKFPLYWIKSDNSGILPDPNRGPRRIVETAFMASRGDRLIVRAKSNAFSHPNTKRIHMSEKPLPMLKYFMEMFVDETTIMLDPTAGSANSVRAAELLGSKKSIGLEINTEFFTLAKERYYDDEVSL